MPVTTFGRAADGSSRMLFVSLRSVRAVTALMHVSLGGTVRRDNRARTTSRRGCPDAGPRDIPPCRLESARPHQEHVGQRHRVELSVGRSPVGSKAGPFIAQKQDRVTWWHGPAYTDSGARRRGPAHRPRG